MGQGWMGRLRNQNCLTMHPPWPLFKHKLHISNLKVDLGLLDTFNFPSSQGGQSESIPSLFFFTLLAFLIDVFGMSG